MIESARSSWSSSRGTAVLEILSPPLQSHIPLSCDLECLRRTDSEDYISQTQTVYVFVDGSLKFFHNGLHIVGVCGVKELSTEFANPVLHETTPPFGEELHKMECSLSDELAKSGEPSTFESKGNKTGGSNYTEIIDFPTIKSPVKHLGDSSGFSRIASQSGTQSNIGCHSGLEGSL